MKTLQQTTVVLLILTVFLCCTSATNPNTSKVSNSSAGFGNVKSWTVTVSVTSSFKETNPGWTHNADLISEINGTITDLNGMLAGSHYVWPMKNMADPSGTDYGSKLQTTFSYKETTHQDGAGASMPEENSTCTNTTSKGSVVISIQPGSSEYGAVIGLSSEMLTCTGNGMSEGNSPSLEFNVTGSVPDHDSVLSGSKHFEVGGRGYDVQWSFSPFEKD